MEKFEPGSFHYVNNKLYCENVSVSEIIEKTGTPVYIYSKQFFTDRYNEFSSAFDFVKHSIFFAVKCNFNLNVIKIFSDLGAGVDVNSGGELFRARKVGIEPDKIILTGVGKTPEEIKLGLDLNLKLIKAESPEELELINKIAQSLETVAPVAIRINPNVDAKTHPYISTGLAENKFGIDAIEAERLFEKYAGYKNIRFTGIDMHIGSQITSVQPYVEAIGRMAEVFKRVKSAGVPLEHFDVGGGIGVQYMNEKVFTPADLAIAVKDILLGLDSEIMFEPGRFLTANGGILVTDVLYTKKNRNKKFIIVDTAMTDLLRPALYSSYHHIQPVLINDAADVVADIVGPVCESSDFLAKNRQITKCKPGDKLAIMSAGAYGMVMASNYNGRRRPPEVIVDGDQFHVSRGRETYDYLLWNEEVIPELHNK